MITADITLTGTPQAITVPDTGARLQSVGGLNFYWRASATTPTDLSNPVKDNDVFIGIAGSIYVWGSTQGQVITVTK